MSEQEMATETNEPRVYEIRPENMAALTGKLARLNMRATKLGSIPVELVIVGEKLVTVSEVVDSEDDWIRGNSLPKTHLEKRILVTVTGSAPKLNGWSIAAVIEHTEGGNILRAVPPFTAALFDKNFRVVAANCDHCGFDRKRKDTYIVRHDDGRHAQVGRTCLKDFTGHQSPEAIATWAEIISMLDEMVSGFGGGMGSGSYYWTLTEVLETAACVIRRDGFMSKARAQKIAAEFDKVTPTTAGTVAWLFAPILGTGAAARKEREEKEAYTLQDSDKAMAELAQDWAATQNPSVDEDYLWNLRVIANMEAITARNFGLAVSMIAAYKREADRLAGIEQERKTRPVSQFVGTLGKREDFIVTLKKVLSFEGNYGTTTLHIMLDQAGNKLTWFKSGHSEMNENSTYVLKGTVKAQEVYTDHTNHQENQTVLSRCKIVREIVADVVALENTAVNA